MKAWDWLFERPGTKTRVTFCGIGLYSYDDPSRWERFVDGTKTTLKVIVVAGIVIAFFGLAGYGLYHFIFG